MNHFKDNHIWLVIPILHHQACGVWSLRNSWIDDVFSCKKCKYQSASWHVDHDDINPNGFCIWRVLMLTIVKYLTLVEYTLVNSNISFVANIVHLWHLVGVATPRASANHNYLHQFVRLWYVLKEVTFCCSTYSIFLFYNSRIYEIA